VSDVGRRSRARIDAPAEGSQTKPDHVDRDPKARFSNRVDDYVRYRPGYPIEIVRTLERELGTRPGPTRIVDIGCGTGISADLFLRQGYAVVGVEPNAAMRAAAENFLASSPRFRLIEGSAEATNLPNASADLVIAAQAFHWFEPVGARREMRRLLAPGGGVALMWNDRRVETNPFLRGYDAAIRKWSIDYAKVNHQNLSDDDIPEPSDVRLGRLARPRALIVVRPQAWPAGPRRARRGAARPVRRARVGQSSAFRLRHEAPFRNVKLEDPARARFEVELFLCRA